MKDLTTTTALRLVDDVAERGAERGRRTRKWAAGMILARRADGVNAGGVNTAYDGDIQVREYKNPRWYTEVVACVLNYGQAAREYIDGEIGKTGQTGQAYERAYGVRRTDVAAADVRYQAREIGKR